MRRSWHCGWMDCASWLPMDQASMPAAGTQSIPATCDVCPGWLVRQDSVGQACEAYFVASALHIYDSAFPDAPACLSEAAVEAAKAWKQYEAELLRKRSEGD